MSGDGAGSAQSDLPVCLFGVVVVGVLVVVVGFWRGHAMGMQSERFAVIGENVVVVGVHCVVVIVCGKVLEGVGCGVVTCWGCRCAGWGCRDCLWKRFRRYSFSCCSCCAL